MEFSQESFERVVGSYPGEGDIGSGRYSTDTRDMGMEGLGDERFGLPNSSNLLSPNSHSTDCDESFCRSAIKQRMEKDVEEVKKIALKIKTMLEQLDKNNMINRQKPGCEKGTAIDRSRMGMTVALKKKLKERMTQFQTLRQNIHEEYREVVERRVFTVTLCSAPFAVTGTRPDEEMVDQLIETGNSELIFEKAIQGQGRGQVVDTLAEIQERRDTMLELEKKLLDLQQMFLDMSVLVDAQGDMLDDIEAQVCCISTLLRA
ncbi:hypothetical protein C4D60_Mb10t20690 [Musa balbisiana]|uniref:t-SNARE coiled-coil homology domain-containing protein n=1 Tax=Musa balbisiana TaxID=52838 RepID=A0A4S8IZG9_MUSBA|nr:hypothetical protein C4D60_Mb10t20690 [Musa balbisiana]